VGKQETVQRSAKEKKVLGSVLTKVGAVAPELQSFCVIYYDFALSKVDIPAPVLSEVQIIPLEEKTSIKYWFWAWYESKKWFFS